MSTALTADRLADDLFTAWVHESRPPQRHRGRQPPGRLRFAFYGRISTSGYQDEASSRQWQYDNAARLTAGHGSVVAEYFDTGYSRSLPWHQRPAAAQLLRDASAPNRDFDAVVIGEYERAFAGRQALRIIPQLQAYGVEVWLPEADGPVDLNDPTHRALIMLLGHQSEREILRARMRTTHAMGSQAATKDATSAAARPTATAWSTPDLTPTATTPAGDGGCTASTPTPPPHRTYGGSSPNASPGPAPQASPAPSTTAASPPPPPTTPAVTATEPEPAGRCAPSRPSSPILATPAGRSGTGNAPTTAKPCPATNTPASGPFVCGTAKPTG